MFKSCNIRPVTTFFRWTFVQKWYFHFLIFEVDFWYNVTGCNPFTSVTIFLPQIRISIHNNSDLFIYWTDLLIDVTDINVVLTVESALTIILSQKLLLPSLQVTKKLSACRLPNVRILCGTEEKTIYYTRKSTLRNTLHCQVYFSNFIDEFEIE